MTLNFASAYPRISALLGNGEGADRLDKFEQAELDIYRAAADYPELQGQSLLDNMEERNPYMVAGMAYDFSQISGMPPAEIERVMSTAGFTEIQTFDHGGGIEGYMAYNPDTQTMVQMFNGSDELGDWRASFDVFRGREDHPAGGTVHPGYFDELHEPNARGNTLIDEMVAFEARIAEQYPDHAYHKLMGGGSRGGALMEIAAVEVEHRIQREGEVDRNAGVTQSLFKMDSPQSGDRAFSERAESLIGMGNNNDATGIHRIEHGINAANRVWKVGRFAGYDHSGHDLEVDNRAEGFNYANAHELRENGMVMTAIGFDLDSSLPRYSPSQLGEMIHDTLQQQQQQAHAQTEPQPAAQDPMAALVAEANIDLSAQGVQGDSQNYGVPYAPDYVPGVQPNNGVQIG